MGVSLSQDEARTLRMISQQFGLPHNRLPREPHDVVTRMVGLQAQDFQAASLQVRSRSRGLLHGDFQQALYTDRSIVRTWCFRSTLHAIPAEDVRWMIGLLGEHLVRASRRRGKELGIGEYVNERADAAIVEALSNGPLTRADLFERLDSRGLDTSGQRGYHLLTHAGHVGLICYGPRREGDQTFVLIDDWVPRDRAGTPRGSTMELARRYLGSYGPVAPRDFQWWSGLPSSLCKEAWSSLSGKIEEIDVEGETLWLLKKKRPTLEAPVRPVRLLAGYDAYLLGYRNRSLVIDHALSKRVNAGGGLVRPILVVNGWVAGTWKLRKKTRRIEVALEPFGRLTRETKAGVEVEVADLGRYLEAESVQGKVLE